MKDLITELAEFLFKAKRSTFAGKGKRTVTRMGYKKYSYRERNWKYIDIYYGSLKDIGQEIVWYKQKPFWGMNYFGGTTINKELEGIFDFLKECLYNLHLEFPIRGPSIWIHHPFLYVNLHRGDITNFKGTEYIFKKTQLIYTKLYHGGIIKNL